MHSTTIIFLVLFGISDNVSSSSVPHQNQTQGTTPRTTLPGDRTHSSVVNTTFSTASGGTHANNFLSTTPRPFSTPAGTQTTAQGVVPLNICQTNMCSDRFSCEIPEPSDCYDIIKNGCDNSGVYTIYPPGVRRGIEVYCDHDTTEGGWTVIQRRVDGSEDFSRDWDDYAFGFGNKTREFWLGNEVLYVMMSGGRKYELRVELESFDGEKRYANYRLFYIGNMDSHYRLTVRGYSGTAGDAMAYHNGAVFSTKDRDRTGGHNCPATYRSGWWFKTCYATNLNGLYAPGLHTTMGIGMEWKQWKGLYYSNKAAEMKIRPW